MRNMSVAYTMDQVRARTKTVTRRKGWTFLRPGDRVRLVEKSMGIKKGERVVQVAVVEVVSVTRSRLISVREPGELTKEGFPELERHPHQGAFVFIDRYFAPQGLGWDDIVTRIEWRYLDESGNGGAS